MELRKEEFRVRRREKGECLREIAGSLMNLARKAYPDLPAAHRNELIVKDRFIDGHDHKEARNKLTPERSCPRPCKTLCAEQSRWKSSRPQRDNAIRAGPNDPILELFRKNQATLEEIARTLKSTRQQQLIYPAQHPSKRPVQRKPITCFNCGKQGHKAAECRRKPSS